MKIQLNENYRITSMPLNFILEERKVKQEGKQAGEEYWKTIGYYGNLDQLLFKLFNLRLQESNVEGIQNIIEEIKTAVIDIKQQIKLLENEANKEG
jgi:hypothetical protein